MRRPRSLLVIAAAAIALTCAGRSHASSWSLDGVYLPVGLTAGGSFQGLDRAGGFVGSEVSLVKVDEPWFFGGFVDSIWDFQSSRLRHAIGPEGGWGPLGIDGGYLGVLEDGVYRPGVTVRAFQTIGFVGGYLRYGHVFMDGPIPDFAEIGILLKVPIPVGGRAASSLYADPVPRPSFTSPTPRR